MKRRQIVKLLMLTTVVLAVTVVWGDVPSPGWRALSHKEWMTKLHKELKTEKPSHFVLPRGIMPCSALVIFLAVLVFSMRQRRPSYLLWLAWCAPLPFFVPITYERGEESIQSLSILSVLTVSWLVPVIFYFRTRKFVQALGCLIVAPFAFVLFWYGVGHSYLGSLKANFKDSPIAYYGEGSWSYRDRVVETREGESYEEYLKRANRIIHHHCNRCDKPMRDYWHDYWRCPNCDKDEMTCSKCGAGKVQVSKGMYWQMGFEWLCPNCDKERCEEIKRQVEGMINGKRENGSSLSRHNPSAQLRRFRV